MPVAVAARYPPVLHSARTNVYGRGKGQAQMIPGWPYSVVAALEPGRTSWTAVLDAVRVGPDDDEAEVTAAQVREVITQLIAAGHWRQGDLPILVIFDAGYDPMRLACQLTGLPVEILGRLRCDRVLHFPVPARQPGTHGRPPTARPGVRSPGPATGRTAVTAAAVDLRKGSGSSSRSLAGPRRNSATPPPLTGGPGSSSPATPSSGSPGRWPQTSACPGNGPPRPAG